MIKNVADLKRPISFFLLFFFEIFFRFNLCFPFLPFFYFILSSFFYLPDFLSFPFLLSLSFYPFLSYTLSSFHSFTSSSDILSFLSFVIFSLSFSSSSFFDLYRIIILISVVLKWLAINISLLTCYRGSFLPVTQMLHCRVRRKV